MKSPGLLQQLGVPNLKFELVSIDFIVGLPKIQAKFGSIMMVVDSLIKMNHLIPIVTIITTSWVVELFMREIFRYHGFPREIISNRNRKFISEFWTTLFKLYGTKIKLNTAYHFETDG